MSNNQNRDENRLVCLRHRLLHKEYLSGLNVAAIKYPINKKHIGRVLSSNYGTQTLRLLYLTYLAVTNPEMPKELRVVVVWVYPIIAEIIQ